MNKRLWIICIILVILAVIIGSFALLYKEPAETKQSEPIVKQIKLTDFVSEEEAKSWQTYKDDEFGFEFRYPKGWNVHIGDYYTNKKIIGLNPNGVEGGSQIMLEVAWNKNKGSFIESSNIVNNIFSHPSFSDKISVTKANINNLEGEIINISIDNYFPNLFFFQKGDLSYILQMTNANKNLFYPILSTIIFTDNNLSGIEPLVTDLEGNKWVPSKFVSSNQNKDWKVHKDDKHGFELKYPGEWVVEKRDNRMIFIGDSSVYDQASEIYRNVPLYLDITKTNFDNLDNWLLDEYLEPGHTKDDVKKEMKKGYVIIDDKKWLFYDDTAMGYGGPGGSAFAFIKDGYVFNIHRGPAAAFYKDSLFIDVISTFKFTK